MGSVAEHEPVASKEDVNRLLIDDRKYEKLYQFPLTDHQANQIYSLKKAVRHTTATTTTVKSTSHIAHFIALGIHHDGGLIVAFTFDAIVTSKSHTYMMVQQPHDCIALFQNQLEALRESREARRAHDDGDDDILGYRAVQQSQHKTAVRVSLFDCPRDMADSFLWVSRVTIVK